MKETRGNLTREARTSTKRSEFHVRVSESDAICEEKRPSCSPLMKGKEEEEKKS